MISSSIRLLKTIANGVTESQEIMKAINVEKSQFYDLVKILNEQDYVERVNSSITFKPNAKTALFLKIAKLYDIEKLLHDSNEEILICLVEPVSMDDIKRVSNLSLATINKSISELESIGIIKKENEKISLDVEKEPVYLFVKLLKAENERTKVESYAEIIYQDQFRVIKKIPKGKSADGELTGFSLFSEYGIDYDTTHDYYVKQDSSLRLEEILIHALLAAYKNNDKNAATIAILFYLKNRDKMDLLNIRTISKSYGIFSIWMDVEGYLRNYPVKHTEMFLPREEFEQKAQLYNMPSELYTLPKAYPQLFKDVGERLTVSAEVCLFGGENMRKKGQKDRTKDCDLVFSDDKSLKAVVKALEDMGYKSLSKSNFSEDDKRIDPFDILEHPIRSRMDLFKTRIAKKLILSEQMIKSADIEKFGKLILRVLRNEHVFLLKAVTLREGDIQDMGKIIQSGNFDWKLVWEELVYQEHATRINFSSALLDSLDDLYEQTRIRAPFYKRLIRRVLEHEISKLVRNNEMPLDGIVTLLEGKDITEKTIRNRIDYLEKKKHLKKIKRGDRVFVQAKKKIVLNVYSNSVIDIQDRLIKHVEKLSIDLMLSDETKRYALDLVRKLSEIGIPQGRKPSGLAAAIIYLATIMKGDNHRIERIAKVANLNQATLRALYNIVKVILPL